MLLNIYFYIFVNTRGYPWISVDIKKFCKRIPDGYGYEYEADICVVGMVQGSYYPYPTCPVDLPT